MDELKGEFKESSLMVAFDLRGHGRSVGPSPVQLTIENLTEDALGVINYYQNLYSKATVFIVGHSLGGSIATRLATSGIQRLLGIVVVDIVEEAALAALQHMPHVLAARPKSFASEDEAVKWALRSHTCKRVEVAEVSFLAQYKEEDGKLAIITDLMGSEPYWRGWFEGMSARFVEAPLAMMLVLAETDYLDKTLLIGQMQGKFQLEIIRNTGHAIQEDQPAQLAKLIGSFVNRNLDVHHLNK